MPADIHGAAAIAHFFGPAYGGARTAEAVIALKLLWAVADYSRVQRAILTLGLSLALCGLTLVGLGEWAAGHFDGTALEGRSSTPLASARRNNPTYDPALAPPLPVLPETSDHLPAGSPGYTFHRDVPEVRLQFTVADEQGRMVSNLSADDVRVLDNLIAVEHFSEFEHVDDLPLQLGLVVDTSDSVKRVLGEERAAATTFLQHVLRPESDTAFVMAFGGGAKTIQTETGDRQALAAAIATMKQPGWGTRLFDALHRACVQETRPNAGRPVHRAVVLLSDGDDTDSLRGIDDVIAAAQRAEVQIYSLTIHAPRQSGRGDEVLQHLADATGGRFYVASSSQQLEPAFTQIEQDLRTQYYVSFSPSQANPGFHSLQVEVRSPKKLVVHARQGYYARTE